jgi:hypothetical protein
MEILIVIVCIFYCHNCFALLLFNCGRQLHFNNDIKIHRWAKVKFLLKINNIKIRLFAHFLSTRSYQHILNKNLKLFQILCNCRLKLVSLTIAI